jgi:hypothetical protein
MKKIILFLITACVSLIIDAQPPSNPQRPLPNQFRDFVDHQQRFGIERPMIEKKDGKVIITMSEEQFKRMQQMRQAQRFRQARFTQQNCCQRCQTNNPRPHRGPRHNKL